MIYSQSRGNAPICEKMGNKASGLLAFQFQKAQSNRVVPKIQHPDTNRITSQPKGMNYVKVKN